LSGIKKEDLFFTCILAKNKEKVKDTGTNNKQQVLLGPLFAVYCWLFFKGH